MLRRLLIAVAALAALATITGWVLTSPHPLQAADLPAHEPDLINGERMFWAGGMYGLPFARVQPTAQARRRNAAQDALRYLLRTKHLA